MTAREDAQKIYVSAIKSVDPYLRTRHIAAKLAEDFTKNPAKISAEDSAEYPVNESPRSELPCGESPCGKLPRGTGKVTVIAVGKAAVPMARAAEDALGENIKAGLCVTKYGHADGFKSDRFEIIEASHPISDENSVKAAERAIELADNAGENDTVLVLLSGGASALLEKSIIPPNRQRTITEKLLKRGADIEQTNAVRRRLSLIKGGRLAEHCFPARVMTVALSDVLSNDKSAIGSGITVRDETTDEAVIKIAKKYLYDEPSDIFEILKKGADKPINDGGYVFAGDITGLLQEAGRTAEELGYKVEICADLLTGEARDAAESVIARSLKKRGGKKRCIIFGGETTVTVRGSGTGGRNQEMALYAALRLDGERDILFVSVGSDGTDGPTDAAGGYADGTTAAAMRAAGINPEISLRNNDSYNALKGADALILTGPTGTNVNDLTFVLIC